MKRTISLIVIIIGLGGAIVMGYMVFRGDSQGLPAEESAPVEDNSNYQILPFGKQLNFQKIEKYNKNKMLFPYPKVAPTEIGAASEAMME